MCVCMYNVSGRLEVGSMFQASSRGREGGLSHFNSVHFLKVLEQVLFLSSLRRTGNEEIILLSARSSPKMIEIKRMKLEVNSRELHVCT